MTNDRTYVDKLFCDAMLTNLGWKAERDFNPTQRLFDGQSIYVSDFLILVSGERRLSRNKMGKCSLVFSKLNFKFSIPQQ